MVVAAVLATEALLGSQRSNISTYGYIIITLDIIAHKWYDTNTKESLMYTCECLDCKYKMESEEHCSDIKCPKCGGEMRREERPGIGKATWTSAYINELPDSAFLYVESGDKDDKSLRHLPYKSKEGSVDLPHLRNAIARANQIKLRDGSTISESKANELKAKAQKLLSEHSKSLWDKMEESVLTEQKSLLRKFSDFLFGESTPDQVPDYPFTVWKDGDTWHWNGIYSNNQKDREGETLTTDAHKTFSTLIEKNIVDLPPLQVWHLPIELGQTTSLWFDESTGEAHAQGTFHSDYHKQAEALSKMDSLGMSHGMPTVLITRNPDTPELITRYISTELTVLPKQAAANGNTFFSSNKEDNMKQVTEEQKKLLVEMNFSEDEISAVEAIRKEVNPDVKEKEEVASEETVETESVEKEDESPLRDEVATALTDLAGSVKTLSDIITIIKKDVEDLKATDETKIAQKAEDTPRASLSDLVKMSVIGDDETRIDGRTSLAKEGPKETEPAQNGPIGIPFLDDMINNKDWRESLGGTNG